MIYFTAVSPQNLSTVENPRARNATNWNTSKTPDHSVQNLQKIFYCPGTNCQGRYILAMLYACALIDAICIVTNIVRDITDCLTEQYV